METRITYNKHTEEIFGWGDQLFGRNNKDYIHCDDFDDGLYSIFKKEKNKWDENDEFLIKAVSDYIRLAAKESIEASKIVTESNDAFHYAFIVPSEWEEEIREELIRPIFIRSDLISKEDHNDKLLFFSDIESISYGLKGKNFKKFLLPRGQNTILCRLVPTKFDTVSVELDLISTMNPLFDFPDSRLFPKVIRSKSISISVEDIKTSIKAFLKTKLSLDNDKIIDAMAEHIYKEELPDMVITFKVINVRIFNKQYYIIRIHVLLVTNFLYLTSLVALNITQMTMINAICMAVMNLTSMTKMTSMANLTYTKNPMYMMITTRMANTKMMIQLTRRVTAFIEKIMKLMRRIAVLMKKIMKLMKRMPV